MTTAIRWEPLPQGYNTGRIDSFEIQIGLDTGSMYVFNINQNRKCWRVPLHENLKLCIGRPVEVQPDANASSAGAGMPDGEAVEMLRWVVEAYHPQWHYEMGKTGYECAFCKRLFKTSKEFRDTDDHKIGCQWAQSVVWLEDWQHAPALPTVQEE